MDNLNEQDYFNVGWVSAAQGIRGESYVRFYTKNPDWLSEVSELRSVKITQAGKDRLKKQRKAEHLEPDEVMSSELLKILRIKAHKQGFIVKFDGIKTRNQSEELKGLVLQIPKSLLEGVDNADDDTSFYFHKIMGFTVFDQNDRSCGLIESHYNNSAHDIIVLKNDFPSKEIPFVNDWIINIDFDNKKISMNLPDGLLDIKA